jgi:hypothetical protein
MPLPSLYSSGGTGREWSIARAAGIGAMLGVLTGLFRTLDPLHQTPAARPIVVAAVAEIAGAALGFALLCAAAAALRNFVARRLIQR